MPSTFPSISAEAAIKPSVIPGTVTGSLTALGLLGALYASFTTIGADLPLAAKGFLVFWLTLSVATSFLITPRNFTVGYLLGLMFMLLGFRVAGMFHYGITPLIWAPLLLALVGFLAQFIDCARLNIMASPGSKLVAAGEWQLTFMRLYIGYDLIPHCTEKLFAGAASFSSKVESFSHYGLPAPAAFTVIAGLSEFGIVVGIGTGTFTRLAAVCGAVYYLIATLVGGHFSNGFGWLQGGWEYSALMIALILSFAYRGAGPFSVDHALANGWTGRRFPLFVQPSIGAVER